MFRATKPFKDTVTGYAKEPSLRIGKKVPDNAVNLAYYFNPTATDSEKILASDPPRQTIDHRVETQYLTKVDQASGPNGEPPSIDLFPKSIYYSDEEGYYGRLARQDETVNWYPEQHTNQKEVSYDNTQIVAKKGDEDKFVQYNDANGYVGNVYIDAVSYETYTTKDVSVTEEVDFTINGFELNYHDIFGTYLNSGAMNDGYWMQEPNPTTNASTKWPARIELTATTLKANSGDNKICNYINTIQNNFAGSNETHVNNANILSTSKPVGYLYFDKLEYEPVKYDVPPKDGTVTQERLISGIKTDRFNWDVVENGESYTNYLPSWQKVKINGEAPTTSFSSSNGYSEIEDFLVMLDSVSGNFSTVKSILQTAINDGKNISIWLSNMTFYVDDESIDMLVNGSDLSGNAHIDAVRDPSSCYFMLGYKYIISDKGTEGTILYNIVASYHTVTLDNSLCSVRRTIKTNKEKAASYKAHCHYSGLVSKNWVDYDGIAYYMGSVTKGNSIGNQNATEDNELLMFPDENGYLRRIVENIKTTVDENGRSIHETVYKNYYRIEADTIYLTDVFKDNTPCFYKYRLKQPIYDYRGPDDKGFYKGDAVKICTSSLKDVPEKYKHNIKLTVAEYEQKTIRDQFNNAIVKNVPKNYYVDLFTSFVSSSTDTFKVIYNGFNNQLSSNIEEDIYNYPYMIEGIDYELKLVNKKGRLNNIHILNYEPIEDNRLRVSFEWHIVAVNNKTGATFYSETRHSSVLNKEYCMPCEYNKFEGRGMIISPKLNGDSIPCSPKDLCLHDQAGYQSLDDNYEPIITDTDNNFTYSVEITSIEKSGTVNIKCNPDGSGYITAETTVDTGFFDEERMSYTKKLDMDNPYWVDGQYIYKGYKVKCIDSRTIKVKAPREDGLLYSWYPMIQFGHYSKILDQYGVHTKVCYSMPEYDTQHYSEIYGQPYVDIVNEQATILNSHMIKTKCCPLYVLYDNNNIPGTIHVFKKIDNELFPLTIENVSFSDGVIIIKDAVSENDNIIVNYTYLEENYIYRGYWRDSNDFVRIDLNPNIYHTYNNPAYLPSEVSPSKNLFNKVIYFFLKPSVEYKITSDNDSLVYDPNEVTIRYETETIDVPHTRLVPKEREVITYDETNINDVAIADTSYASEKFIAEFIPEQTYTGSYSVTMNTGHWYGFSIYEIPDGIEEIAIEDMSLYTLVSTSGFNHATHNNNIPLTVTINSVELLANKRYAIYTKECSGGGTEQGKFTYGFTVDRNFVILLRRKHTETYQEEEIYYTQEERTKEIKEYVYDSSEPTMENDVSIYHKIDDSIPDSDQDILIGSVYIRQNTSLHSTIITDARKRGGGILEEISNSLRQELEPESDFYLDIGYYDGEPYQENGVIIVRLDNRLLKEYGGRFTTGDVEQKVKRWLGVGVYPIIEFVDSYKKEDLPQYNLEIKDNYTNVIDITPMFYIETDANAIPSTVTDEEQEEDPSQDTNQTTDNDEPDDINEP